jgi:hypothetical protein
MLIEEFSEEKSYSEERADKKSQRDSDDLARLYETAEIAEKNLEELVTDHAYLIEEGLVCLDHGFDKDGRMNALFLDSDNSLVIAEIKIGDSEDMLLHCLDYYNRIMDNLADYSRMLKAGDDDMKINIARRPRLIIIATEFSQNLLEKLRWLSIDISVFQIKCIKPMDSKKILPVFFRVSIPETPEIQETNAFVKTVEEEKSRRKLDIYFDAAPETPKDVDSPEETEEDVEETEESEDENE